jgi:hypothetical protein
MGSARFLTFTILFCICAAGHPIVPAVHKLAAAGYSASSLKNGMLAWLMAKLPIHKGLLNGRTGENDENNGKILQYQ